MSSHQLLDINGHKLAVLPFNPGAAGEPIILIHGITSSVYFWLPDTISYCLECGPCYSLSLPGHYPAAFPSGFQASDLTAELIADLLTRAVRQLVGDRPATLIGHSTGGFAALAMAARTPGLAKRVESVSGFAQGRWTGVLGQLQGLARGGPLGSFLFKSNTRILSSRVALYRWALRFYAADAKAMYAYPPLEKTLQITYPYTRQLDPESMRIYFERMPEIDITAWLPRIQAPTLVITGDQDPIVPPAQADLIASRVPHAEKLVLRAAGHLPFSERPAEYDAKVKDWFLRTC